MATLMFYKGKKRFSNKLISWWTNSDYSHCEIKIGEFGYSSSLVDGGVRKKKISWNTTDWDEVEIPWASDTHILSYFYKTDGKRYGIVDLIFSQILNIPFLSNSSAEFCSEFCANALGIPNGQMYSPKSLYDLVVWRNSRM